MPTDNEITLQQQLSAAGVLAPAQAQKNLDLLRGSIGDDAFSALLPALLSSLSGAGDPDQALNNLERFVAALDAPAAFAGAIERRPQALPELVVLFGASRFLSTFLASSAGVYLPLFADSASFARPATGQTVRDRLAAVLKEAKSDDDLYRMLRRFRKEEMLRIALRDLQGAATLSETVAELSLLAEASLQGAYEWIDAKLGMKHGRPMVTLPDGTAEPAGFAVIGMGKLGGGELNFSSDIDLLYVYSADGETEGIAQVEGEARTGRITNHQYFVKLAEHVTAAISRNTAEGFVFRVDLRLRPEGRRGPLAQSLGGCEIYYESWGQSWERAALIKARPVAGSEAVGREFLERIAPFVYRKYLDFGAIAEIREMKQKINREVQLKGKTHRDVKLGYGGIREVEFLVQALQLMYGGRDRSLRERGSLRALHVLAQKGLITYRESAELSKAYEFLRTLEHRIQLVDDVQTQTLPTEPAELRTLARRCGHRAAGAEAEALLREYGDHTRRVRGIYDDLFTQTPPEGEHEQARSRAAVLLDPETGEQDAILALAQYGFRDPAKALRNIAMLREGQAFVHQTPRSRRIFTGLFPDIFQEIVDSPDPDMALNHFESFLAAQESWDAFQAFIGQDRMMVRMLVSVFGNSEYFSRLLIRTPSILGDLRDRGRGLAAGRRVLRADLAALFAGTAGTAEAIDALRRFKHREEIRIGMADLLGSLHPTAVWAGLSRVAEACLDAALSAAAAETGKRYGVSAPCSGIGIIGLGKLGGRELTYGSDLDILFAYSEERAPAPLSGLSIHEYYSKTAEKTISYLTSVTREGFAYRVDTRLRPGGSKGPLAQSLSAFRSYFATSARTWERQAFVNWRLVAGDPALGPVFSEAVCGLIYPDDGAGAAAAEIRAMRLRMEEELGRDDEKRYNIKQGRGGLVDIMFLAQYLQMKHGGSNRRVTVPGTFNALHALRKAGLLAADDYETLRSAYFFMRRIESRMRILSNQASSDLTRDRNALRVLARRLGYADEEGQGGASLLREYELARERVRSAFDRIVAD